LRSFVTLARSRDFDVSAAGSEIVFDRVQATSDLALIELAH